MGLLGRSFVIAGLTIGVVVTGFVVTTQGAPREGSSAPAIYAKLEHQPVVLKGNDLADPWRGDKVAGWSFGKPAQVAESSYNRSP